MSIITVRMLIPPSGWRGDLDYAYSQGVPMWNADQWLSFTQTRHDADYTNLVWDGSTGLLSFNINMTATAGMTPTTILPLSYGGRPLQSVAVDGGVYTYSTPMIKGTNVAFVSIPAGNHSVNAVYGPSGKLPQTITFNSLPDKAYGDPSFTVSATASSGLTVTFTVSGACINSGTNGATVTLTGAGSCTVTAHQPGNATYDPAPAESQTFTIGKASSVVTVDCTAGAPHTYTGSAQTPCTAQATGVGYECGGCECLAGSSANNTNGDGAAATATANWGGDANHTGAAGRTVSPSARRRPWWWWTARRARPTPIRCGADALHGAGDGCGDECGGCECLAGLREQHECGDGDGHCHWGGDANHTGSSGSGSFTVGKASSVVAVGCTAHTTGSAQTPCTAQATGVGMSPVDVSASLVSANNGR